MNKPKIGITFSGGGTRSVAQIGVIKAFRDSEIEATAVAGTSGGSIVATLYAAGLTTDEMMAFANEGSLYRLYRPALPTNGVTSLAYLRELLQKYLEFHHFEELYLPLYVNASNLMTGRAKIFKSGNVIDAVVASCSVPLLFKPVEIDGELYADGGIFDNMPVKPLRETCDIVIGVNIMPNVEVKKKEVDNMFSIGMRVFDLVIFNTTKQSFYDCDIVIQPKEVYKYNIFNFSHFDMFFEAGYNAAIAQIEEIKTIIEQHALESVKK